MAGLLPAPSDRRTRSQPGNTSLQARRRHIESGALRGIGQHDVGGLFPPERHPFVAVRSAEDRIACPFRDAPQYLAERQFIVNNEHARDGIALFALGQWLRREIGCGCARLSRPHSIRGSS